jgi:prepilin-type N-terminal cleavage/methylation domain-containing protein/prepilin-type processing-associated H-X9-DG protein
LEKRKKKQARLCVERDTPFAPEILALRAGLEYRTGMKRQQRVPLCQGVNPKRFQLAKSNRKAGFSLIELLMVVLIIALLSALVWGALGGNKEKSKLVSCQQNLQKIHISMQIYANDSGNRYPIVPGALSSEQALSPLVPKYSADTSIFICPGVDDSPSVNNDPLSKQHISYAYYMGRTPGDAQTVLMSDAQVNSLSKNSGQQIFSATGKPPGNNHKKAGGNFLFSDGHADSTISGAPFSLVLTQGVVLLHPSSK